MADDTPTVEALRDELARLTEKWRRQQDVIERYQQELAAVRAEQYCATCEAHGLTGVILPRDAPS